MNFYASSSRALVGTYTRRSSRRAIEADLRARLREIPTHKEPMMDNKTLDRLPPLPEPEDGPMLRNHPYYTAEQMREYAAAALRATTGEGDGTATVLQARADAAYCDYIRQLDRPECRGWEMKVASGKFGSEELRGHVSAGELLGRHRALNEAAAMLAAAPTPAEPLRDAGEVEALYVDDVLTITDVSKTLGEIAENFDGGEYAISDESRRILIDFAHGLPDEGLWSIVECYFAQKYRAGSVYGWMHEIEWKGERTERVFSKCKPKRLAGPWSITSQAIFPLYTHSAPAQPDEAATVGVKWNLSHVEKVEREVTASELSAGAPAAPMYDDRYHWTATLYTTTATPEPPSMHATLAALTAAAQEVDRG